MRSIQVSVGDVVIRPPGNLSARRSRSRMNLGRGKGVPSKLGALSRRAERGDFVAQRGEVRVGSADEQFEGKILEPHADLRFPRRLSDIILQRPRCGDRTARCQRSRS
jgi:hypothetical protein